MTVTLIGFMSDPVVCRSTKRLVVVIWFPTFTSPTAESVAKSEVCVQSYSNVPVTLAGFVTLNEILSPDETRGSWGWRLSFCRMSSAVHAAPSSEL